MAEEITEPTKALTAPYGAWETMKNALEAFSQGVPPRIDRSAFPGLSWNATTRLLNGMRFLGFIADDGTPQATFMLLATEAEELRKTHFSEVLMMRYPELFKLNLAVVTPAHLAETLGAAYNVAGDTREKAVRFFVGAATYAGLTLSPLLRERASRPVGTSRAKRSRVAGSVAIRGGQRDLAIVPTHGGSVSTRTVTLRSGGTLTLTTAVNFLEISAADRQFVFEINDKLAAYERGAEGAKK